MAVMAYLGLGGGFGVVFGGEASGWGAVAGLGRTGNENIFAIEEFLKDNVFYLHSL